MSIRTLTQQDPIGLAGGLNLYGYAGSDPINFSDPFGLRAEGDDEKKTLIQRAMSKLKEGVGKVVDKLIGDAPSTVDAVTGQPTGTTRASIVEGVLNPPADLGSVSVTATGYVGPFSRSTDGTVSGYVGGVVGATIDVTYAAPGGRNDAVAVGSISNIGTTPFLGGLSGGVTASGRPNSVTVSGGLGVAATLPRIPTVLKLGSGRYNVGGGN